MKKRITLDTNLADIGVTPKVNNYGETLPKNLKTVKDLVKWLKGLLNQDKAVICTYDGFIRNEGMSNGCFTPIESPYIENYRTDGVAYYAKAIRFGDEYEEEEHDCDIYQLVWYVEEIGDSTDDYTELIEWDNPDEVWKI